jgi:hypothetical protein
MPQRIQRKRTKGWKMPPGAVYVGRPTLIGNPFSKSAVPDATETELVEMYREHIEMQLRGERSTFTTDDEEWVTKYRSAVEALRGKDLACWCALDKPCHADVLLEIANRN